MISSRAKYQCNPKLKEYIELVNIIPADFDFEWSPEDKIGINPKFVEWMGKLLDLSPTQAIELISAKVDGAYILLEENFPGEATEGSAFKFAAIALVQFLKMNPIRSFLRNLVKLNELSEEKYIKNLTANKNIFQTLNQLHSNTQELFELPATKKVYQTLKKKITNVQEYKMMGIAVQYTANYIGAEETEKFGITDDEKHEFIWQWSKSFGEKIQDAENYLPILQKFDFLAQTLLEVEMRVSTVSCSVDDKGNVHFELNNFAKSLQDVNISRLRRCEYCDLIFWANRKDSYTCSLEHARNRRMRLLRENWKQNGDLYLKARKKKARKKRENKQNGNL